MIDRLPYTLTAGVVATQKGLVIHDRMHLPVLILYIIGSASNGIISWPDAAELLRYREGEPWCHLNPASYDIITGPPSLCAGKYQPHLHRLAAILCDDAEAFRVLHWCVINLGDENEPKSGPTING